MGVTCSGRQFLLLMWKNWKLTIRSKVATILEFIIPLVFVVLLAGLRIITDTNKVDVSTIFPSFPVDQGNFKRVLYAPKNALTDEVMGVVSQKMKRPKLATGYPTEAKMVEAFKISANPSLFFGGVVFDGMDTASTLPATIKYKIRPNSETEKWRTSFKFPFVQRLEPRGGKTPKGKDPGYVSSGFIDLQCAIDTTLIEMANNRSTPLSDEYMIHLRRVPYPPYISDPFIQIIQSQMSLIMLLSYIYIGTHITKNIVHEREKRLVETMKMMGLRAWIYWVSWYVRYLIQFLIIFSVSTALLCAHLGSMSPVIPESDGTLIFVFLVLYGMATISFCFMLTVIFNKATSAASGGGVLFFLSYIPQFFVAPVYETFPRGGKLGVSLISNVGMSIGIRIIGYHEGTGKGAQWSNLNQPAIIDDNVSLLDIMIMLIVDTVFYLVVLWYFDTVRPGEFGVPRPWYFPVMKSYWCGDLRVLSDDHYVQDDSNHKDLHEKDPVGLKNGISIKNLRKVYGAGETRKVAVAGMKLNMFEGQITALLGHNGAGKTTTMSMLTGFIPPSSGTAIINGHDIATDIAAVRSDLGLCPQHDILFDQLTVEEHIWFFAQLKGLSSSAAKVDAERMIDVLELLPKKSAMSSTLSGGQKRKLSVGIALSANSKVIVLDEPSSGLDPSARRQLWDLLLKHRVGRTILLSTHFMDEADVLSDRIAIMAEGVVKCCGSPLFLKNKYGAGYHLTIVKTPQCNVGQVTTVIGQHIPGTVVHSNIAAELSYMLPHDQASKFEQLFTEVEQRKKELGIATFGVSETTMEDVFLRVGEYGNEDQPKAVKNSSVPVSPEGHNIYDTSHIAIDDPKIAWNERSPLLTDFNDDLQKNTGSRLLLQQFYGMFIKKMIQTWRNRLVTFVQLFLPVFFTILALAADKISKSVSLKPVELTMAGYEDNFVPVSAGTYPDNFLLALKGVYAGLFTGTNVDVVASSANVTNFVKHYFVKQGLDTTRDNSYFTSHYLMGMDLEADILNRSVFMAYFSGEAYHTTAISLAYLMDAMHKTMTGSGHSIKTVNDPMPKSANNLATDLTLSFQGFSIAFNILFGIAFMVSSFVIFLIKERAVRSKHVQISSGAKLWIFWLANFTWDLINFLVPCLVMLIVFAAFQLEAFVSDHRLGMVFFLFVLFAWSIIPLVYILQFPFKSAASGMAAISILNILFGMITLIAVVILMIPNLGTGAIAKVLEWVFLCISPHFCFSRSIMQIYLNFALIKTCADPSQICSIFPNPCCKATGNCGQSDCIAFEENYMALDFPGIGWYIIAMAAQGFLFILIVMTIDYGYLGMLVRFLGSLRHKGSAVDDASDVMGENDDSDVVEESKRIRRNPQQVIRENTLVIDRMSRTFGYVLAVDELSLAVPTGECFGLLGVNGAGKTTSFKMLTGDLKMTSGDAFLNGFSVRTEQSKTLGDIGYCPQYDTLIDQMTGSEMLYLFARIRGIKSSQIPRVVNGLLASFLLTDHADKQTCKYSGGNKRKLTSAISVIGDPSIIFMDEPTTGMDPAARRQLWSVLSHIRSTGRTLIFTSHSMEECDALCTRLAIMVNGVFRCLGSAQHLKSKYGEGYTLNARVACPPGAPYADLQPLMTYIEMTFPNHRRIDASQGYVNYQLTDPSESLGRVFGAMESARGHFYIEDYSVSQTTLDQVFINFARAQRESTETENVGCFRRLMARI